VPVEQPSAFVSGAATTTPPVNGAETLRSFANSMPLALPILVPGACPTQVDNEMIRGGGNPGFDHEYIQNGFVPCRACNT